MPNIRQRLLIASEPQSVYAALTTQAGLSSWWTPDVKATPQEESTARFGFKPPYVKEMKIVDLEAGRRVEWRCVEGVDEWKGTTLSFELEGGDKESLLRAHPEMGDQASQLAGAKTTTLLTFGHDNWREYTPMFAECSFTWGQFLRSLKLLCETGKGRPWPSQHRLES
jgi:uncharacterized protein YndB with AHSA1/START domain